MSKVPKYRGADFVDYQLRVDIKKKKVNNNDVIMRDEVLRHLIDKEIADVNNEIKEITE